MRRTNLYFIILAIIVLFLSVIMIHSLAVHKTKSVKLYLLMKSNSPIAGIEKINDDKILLESLKTFVKRKGEKIKVYFGNGRISFVHVDLSRKTAKILWNYSLKGYRIFSYPCVTNNGIVIAIVNTTLNNSEILKISDHKIRKVATVKFHVLRINLFGNGAFLLTGFKGKIGKVVLLKNSSKIFEANVGNKTMSALILDINGDGYKDFLVSGVIFNKGISKGFVSVFLNTSSGFKEVKRVEVPKDIVWNMKILNLGKERRIVLFGPRGIHLLNLSNGKVKTIFTSRNGYYLSPVEAIDINHDGFDEFFCVYHNETQSYFVELKYFSGKLHPVFEYPINLEGSFAIKYMKNSNFTIASSNGKVYLGVLSFC